MPRGSFDFDPCTSLDAHERVAALDLPDETHVLLTLEYLEHF